MRGAPPLPHGSKSPTPHRTAVTNMPSSQRRVDDFRRADGFHAPQRRSLQSVRPQYGPSPSPRINMALPGEAVSKHDHRATKLKHGKLRAVRKWTFRTVVVCLVLVIGVGGLLFSKGFLKLHKVFQGGSSAAALTANVDPTKLKGEGDGRVNVLLLGVGGAGHDGGDLTDTIMVASIDPVNNQAVLLSVPRDLWVKMPNNYISNYQKINAAYESGKYKYLGKQDIRNNNRQAIDAGFQAVDNTVEQVLGTPIHYNVLVDFQAFRQAIDTVGGVSVNVPEQLYDPTMAWENHWNPVLAKAGVQTMDGTKALMYVRSRETSSDFARSERQRSVMLALKDKVFTMGTLSNPLKISNLISAFGDNVQSDISVNDASRLVAVLKKIPNNSIQSVGFADDKANLVTTANVNGLSVVQPKAGPQDFSKIQEFVRSKLKDGYISQENANITVLNGTFTPGLASEKADELKTYGYNIGKVDNAPNTDFTQTQIVDLSNGADKYTLHYLQNRFNVSSVTKTLPTGVVAGSANIVIILGQDATTTP